MDFIETAALKIITLDFTGLTFVNTIKSWKNIQKNHQVTLLSKNQEILRNLSIGIMKVSFFVLDSK